MGRNPSSASRTRTRGGGDPDAWPPRVRGARLEGPLGCVAVTGWLASAASIAYYFHLAEGAPRDATGSFIHPFANHGDTFYVTRFQHDLYFGLLLGGGLVFLLAVGAGMVRRTLEARRERWRTSGEDETDGAGPS